MHNNFGVGNRATAKKQNRQHSRHNRQLAKFHANVEEDQCDELAVGRQSKLTQHARKTETAYQPERKSHNPKTARDDQINVVDRGNPDGCGDRGFDDPGR